MRFYNLVTIERRGGMSFQLKHGHTLIGTMTLNSEKARHELELSEPDFLRLSKAIALVSRIIGCGVYVESVRDDDVEKISEDIQTLEKGWDMGRDALPLEVQEFHSGYNLAMDGQPLPDLASEAAKAGHNLVVWKMATETHQAAVGDGTPEEIHGSGVHRWQDALPEVDASTPFKKLVKIAGTEGADISKCKSNAERAEAINASRARVAA